MLRVTVKETCWYGSSVCEVCGARFHGNGIDVAVVDDSEDGELHICPECLRAGPMGVAERAAAQARDWREWADRLERYSLRVTPCDAGGFAKGVAKYERLEARLDAEWAQAAKGHSPLWDGSAEMEKAIADGTAGPDSKQF